MSAPLDEDVVQRVDDLGPTTWSGTVHRCTAANRDPRSGAGARLFGGRWNPRGAFSTICLARPAAACTGEVERSAAASNIPVAAMIRRGFLVHTLRVHELPVLDLREPAALHQVGLGPEDVDDEDWTACRAVGHAAHFLGFGGLIAPSATGLGHVLAVFETRLRPGQLQVETFEPLTDELHQHLRTPQD